MLTGGIALKNHILSDRDVHIIEEYLSDCRRITGFKELIEKARECNPQIQEEARLLSHFIKAMAV